SICSRCTCGEMKDAPLRPPTRETRTYPSSVFITDLLTRERSVLCSRPKQMSEARAAEVLPNRLGQPLVLPQHHPTRERSLAGVQAGRDAVLGAGTRAVQRPRHPTAARAGRADRARQQRGVGAAAPLEVVGGPQG